MVEHTIAPGGSGGDDQAVAPSVESRACTLVIDDQPLVRRGLASVLRERAADVRVCEAGCVDAAVEVARACRPGLILLDADLDGLRPAALIPRLDEAVPQAKIVVMALRGDAGDVRMAFAAGADGYVSKQADVRELELALAEVERGGKYLDPRLGASLASESLPASRATSLSQRERRILELVAAGLTNGEIAAELGLSIRTIDANRARAQRKLHLHTRAEVVAYVRGH